MTFSAKTVLRLSLTLIPGYLMWSSPLALCQVAQPTGEIAGTVRDPSGGPLPNAVVLLARQDSGSPPDRETTDPSGHYAFPALPYGVYQLSASSTDYQSSSPRLVILSSSRRTVDLTLARSASGSPGAPVPPAPSNPAPSFSSAGVRGTIAPSGYSTGLSSEEAARVTQNVRQLRGSSLDALLPHQGVAACDQEPVLLRAAQQAPKDFQANRRLGLFYLGHGQFHQSLPWLQAAHAALPGNIPNTRDLAIAFLGDARSSDALNLLEPLAAAQPFDPATARLLARAYEALNLTSQAVAAWQHAAALDPSLGNQVECGMGLLGVKAAEQARTLFTAATRQYPQAAGAWLGLGIAEDVLQHKSAAVQALLLAAKNDPANPAPYPFLAQLASAVPSSAAEIRRRLSAFTLAHPDDGAAHFDYALALWEQAQSYPAADTAEIVSQLQAALALDPSLSQAHQLLGQLYANRSDNVLAEKEFKTVVELDPANPEAHYRLAQIARKQGDRALADAELARFRDLHGDTGEDGISRGPALPELPAPARSQASSTAQCPPLR